MSYHQEHRHFLNATLGACARHLVRKTLSAVLRLKETQLRESTAIRYRIVVRDPCRLPTHSSSTPFPPQPSSPTSPKTLLHILFPHSGRISVSYFLKRTSSRTGVALVTAAIVCLLSFLIFSRIAQAVYHPGGLYLGTALQIHRFCATSSYSSSITRIRNGMLYSTQPIAIEDRHHIALLQRNPCPH